MEKKTKKGAYLAIKGNSICLLCEPFSAHQIIEVVQCLQALNTHFTANKTASCNATEQDINEVFSKLDY